jgi:hypothetical protein
VFFILFGKIRHAPKLTHGELFMHYENICRASILTYGKGFVVCVDKKHMTNIVYCANFYRAAFVVRLPENAQQRFSRVFCFLCRVPNSNVYLNHIQQTSIVHKSHYKKASYTHY